MFLGSIYLFVVCIPLILIVYFTDKSATKPNGNIILGSTVPRSKMDNEELLKIVEEYKRDEKKFILLGLITAIPIIFVSIKFESIAVIYLLIWMVLFMIGENSCLKKAFNKVQNLKRKNDWFTLKKRVISVDTEVSREKNKMVISKLYFIPVIIINIIGVTFVDNLVISLSIVSTAIGCFILYMYYLKRPTIVYSKNTQVNLGCNLVYRREWSIMWTVCAFLSSMPNIGFIFNETIGVISMFVAITVIIIVVFIGFSKIRDTQNRLLGSVNDEIYVDDDEYWKGIVYNNPNDKRFMVEKRVGIGTTINFAHPGGKIFMGITIAILAAVIIPIGVMSFKLINTSFDLVVDNNKVTIEAPMYDINFDKDDIKDLSIISEMPKASRTNGVSDRNISLGNYKVEGYGKSKLYVKNDVKKIITIKLNNGYIFITGSDEEESQKYYEELINR